MDKSTQEIYCELNWKAFDTINEISTLLINFDKRYENFCQTISIEIWNVKEIAGFRYLDNIVKFPKDKFNQWFI